MITRMQQAAEDLEQVCQVIDNAEELDATLTKLFDDSKLKLQHEVDRRISFYHWLESQITAHEEAFRHYRSELARLKNVRDKFKSRTEAAIKANPGFNYQGLLGKLRIQKNGNPRVLFGFGDKKLSRGVVEMFNIDEKYIKLEVDTSQVSNDLKNGREIPWASLEYTSSIRFPSLKKGMDEDE